MTERPVTSESVNALFTSGLPNGDFSANGRVEVRLVRVQREVREPDVVGLGDRAPEPAAVHVADREVLEEPALPARHNSHPRTSAD